MRPASFSCVISLWLSVGACGTEARERHSPRQDEPHAHPGVVAGSPDDPTVLATAAGATITVGEVVALAREAELTPRGALDRLIGEALLAKEAERRGYGARLFDRAAMHVRNAGVSRMFIHALSENTAMLNIARKAGAILQRDGSEAEAHLHLAPPTLDSRLSELLAEQVAQTDYRIKVQAKQFWTLLTSAQRARDGLFDQQKGSRH